MALDHWELHEDFIWWIWEELFYYETNNQSWEKTMDIINEISWH